MLKKNATIFFTIVIESDFNLPNDSYIMIDAYFYTMYMRSKTFVHKVVVANYFYALSSSISLSILIFDPGLHMSIFSFGSAGILEATYPLRCLVRY